MRKTISGMVAAVAVMITMGAAPAMACYTGCGGGWAAERLPDPVHQYYYVNQGPTYTGPGNWAPRPVYQETSVSYGNPYYGGYRARPHYGYSARPSVRYGYAPRVNYGPRYGYAHRHGMRNYGHVGYHGHRHMLRRYN